MRRLFENKLIVFIVIATIVALITIGVFSSVNRKTSVVENIGGTVTVPAQNATSGVGGWFRGIANYFGNVKSLRELTESLKSENISLEKQIKDTQGLSKENEELKRMLNLKEKSVDISMEAANVAAKDPSNWYTTFTISKGSDYGIKRNQPVVDSNRYLIGQIIEVGENWSRVITVLDPQSSIGGLIRRSKVIGIIEGNSDLRYDGKCRLGYIARDTDIQNGDFVETSGLGGVFPKGLLIGTVSEVYDENATMSRAATVEPLANISKVDKVFVITSFRDVDLAEGSTQGDEDERSDSHDGDKSEDENSSSDVEQ